MQQSARRKIQYPSTDRSDRPDIPAHILNLVNALEVDVIFNVGLDTDRQASPHQVGGGRVWWTTDTHILWFDDGTTWNALGNAPLNSPGFTGMPTAPTPDPTDNSNAIATTAFVHAFFPAGIMAPYAGSAAPTGWLFADGSAVGRGTYAALFAAIGTQFGVGDGTTTFNLPDMRGRVAVGKNSGTFSVLGSTGGEETHAITVGEMPAHTHTGTTGTESNDHTHSGSTGIQSTTHTHAYSRAVAVLPVTSGTGSGGQGVTWDTPQTGTDSANHTHAFTTGGRSAVHTHSFTTASSGGGGAHNNLQPYLTTNYIIKT